MADSFLFIGDYAKAIQSDNLSQVIGGQSAILADIQLAAIEECVSYLRQKFDVSFAFTPISKWDRTQTYNAGKTIYLDASVYSASATYALKSLCLQAGNVYQCSTAITVAEAFNAAHWTLLGAQYTKYYAKMPEQLFQQYQIYKKGDKVFWNNKTYECYIPSTLLDHQAALNINEAGSPVVNNAFPDADGQTQWINGTAYSVPADTEITNTTYWSEGDARDQKLLMTCVDIALFHIHARISPRNIPELRTHRYSGMPEDRTAFGGRIIYPTYSALGWLQGCGRGDITPELPILQPKQGRRIRFGGNQKLVNSY